MSSAADAMLRRNRAEATALFYPLLASRRAGLCPDRRHHRRIAYKRMPYAELGTFVNDFVFDDRRIADHRTARVTVFFLRRGKLVTAAAAGGPAREPARTQLVSRDYIEKMVLREAAPVYAEDLGSVPTRYVSVPILAGRQTIGCLSLQSDGLKRDPISDVNRMLILSALIAGEVIRDLYAHLSRPPFEDLASALVATRKELGLTLSALAERAGISRIDLSRWEQGTHFPTSGLLRRWAVGLGLLAGGKSTLVKVIDVTPELLDLLRREPTELVNLAPERFEMVVADRLDRMGYDVQFTGQTSLRDGGVDMIAVPRAPGAAAFLLAVQAKHHRQGRSTGRDAVDRLLAWQNSAFRLGLLVTNTRFTKDAVWAASKHDAKHFLRLRDFGDLSRWLQDVFGSELDWREIPDVIELAPGISVRVPKPTFREAGSIWPAPAVLAEDT